MTKVDFLSEMQFINQTMDELIPGIGQFEYRGNCLNYTHHDEGISYVVHIFHREYDWDYACNALKNWYIDLLETELKRRYK